MQVRSTFDPVPGLGFHLSQGVNEGLERQMTVTVLLPGGRGSRVGGEVGGGSD